MTGFHQKVQGALSLRIKLGSALDSTLLQKYRVASLDKTAVGSALELNSVHKMKINYLKTIKNVKVRGR